MLPNFKQGTDDPNGPRLVVYRNEQSFLHGPGGRRLATNKADFLDKASESVFLSDGALFFIFLLIFLCLSSYLCDAYGSTTCFDDDAVKWLGREWPYLSSQATTSIVGTGSSFALTISAKNDGVGRVGNFRGTESAP